MPDPSVYPTGLPDMNPDYRPVTAVDGIRQYLGSNQVVAFDFETAPNSPCVACRSARG